MIEAAPPADVAGPAGEHVFVIAKGENGIVSVNYDD